MIMQPRGRRCEVIAFCGDIAFDLLTGLSPPYATAEFGPWPVVGCNFRLNISGLKPPNAPRLLLVVIPSPLPNNLSGIIYACEHVLVHALLAKTPLKLSTCWRRSPSPSSLPRPLSECR